MRDSLKNSKIENMTRTWNGWSGSQERGLGSNRRNKNVSGDMGQNLLAPHRKTSVLHRWRSPDIHIDTQRLKSSDKNITKKFESAW